MKLIFCFALLANILFFLWEYNHSSFQSAQSIKTENQHSPKQILLLSEVVKQSEKSNIVFKDETIELPASFVIAEVKPLTKSVPESDVIVDIGKIQQDLTIEDNQSKQGALEEEAELVVGFGHEDKADQENIILKPENKMVEAIANPIIKNIDQAEQFDLPIQAKKTYCYEIGPFQDQDTLQHWLTLNEKKISSSQQIAKNANTKVRYLVYYPAAESYEKSEENIQRFKSMGVNEVWLFRKGELKGSISFGLFSLEKRALDLQKKISEKGIHTEILHSGLTAPSLYLQLVTHKESMKGAFTINNKQTVSECEVF